MSLFGKKKKSASRSSGKKSLVDQQLEALERGQSPSSRAKSAAPTGASSNQRADRVESNGSAASDALFATLSHELRTPLNGVLGMAQLLKEDFTENPKLETLESCAQHMQSILHTLANLAKIQNQWGHLPEHREWISLRDKLEQIKKNLAYRAGTRRLKMEVQHENDTLRLRGDYDHLTNIIETAILGSLECTDINAEGAPSTLKVSWRQVDGEIKIVIENPLEIMPRNRGQQISEVSGMTPGAMHSRIRMEFLYWAVSIALLEHYDGAMVATKLSDSQGVRTTIAFKMETMEASPSTEKPIGGLSYSADGKGANPQVELPFCMRVLVVEDDPINRELLELLLERIGQKPVLAKDGQAALDLLERGQEYDLILMDIDMPVLDGMSSARAIRAGEGGDAAISLPIVAVTAFNTLSDESKFKKAGMNYFLPKPVALKDLRSVLLDVNRKGS